MGLWGCTGFELSTAAMLIGAAFPIIGVAVWRIVKSQKAKKQVEQKEVDDLK